ncbi:hypothetical protein Tco_0466621 [Tanacetum coccineum]
MVQGSYPAKRIYAVSNNYAQLLTACCTKRIDDMKMHGELTLMVLRACVILGCIYMTRPVGFDWIRLCYRVGMVRQYDQPWEVLKSLHSNIRTLEQIFFHVRILLGEEVHKELRSSLSLVGGRQRDSLQDYTVMKDEFGFLFMLIEKETREHLGISALFREASTRVAFPLRSPQAFCLRSLGTSSRG